MVIRVLKIATRLADNADRKYRSSYMIDVKTEVMLAFSRKRVFAKDLGFEKMITYFPKYISFNSVVLL
jgi:hypothetical protein